MRLIDADAFKEYIQGACDEMSHMYKDGGKLAKQITDSFCMDIDEQPTVSAEPQWTPVKKGYPTESGYYNVTIMGYLDDRLEPAVEYYSPNTARDKKRWKAINVIAWRPADVYRE